MHRRAKEQLTAYASTHFFALYLLLTAHTEHLSAAEMEMIELFSSHPAFAEFWYRNIFVFLHCNHPCHADIDFPTEYPVACANSDLGLELYVHSHFADALPPLWTLRYQHFDAEHHGEEHLLNAFREVCIRGLQQPCVPLMLLTIYDCFVASNDSIARAAFEPFARSCRPANVAEEQQLMQSCDVGKLGKFLRFFVTIQEQERRDIMRLCAHRLMNVLTHPSTRCRASCFAGEGVFWSD